MERANVDIIIFSRIFKLILDIKSSSSTVVVPLSEFDFAFRSFQLCFLKSELFSLWFSRIWNNSCFCTVHHDIHVVYFTYGDKVHFNFNNSYQFSMFYGKAALKRFAKFTGNHVRKRPFLKSISSKATGIRLLEVAGQWLYL